MPAPFGPPGGGMPPQQQKKKQLPPKLFGGWTATLDDPESYQSQTIDRAEARLGGEEAIDETQPKEIFKGLNASEQMRRRRQLQQMNAMGGMPVRESRKPRPGSNRWWNNINEKVTNNPEIGKFFSEQIDKVLINEKDDGMGPGSGSRGKQLASREMIPVPIEGSPSPDPDKPNRGPQIPVDPVEGGPAWNPHDNLPDPAIMPGRFPPSWYKVPPGSEQGGPNEHRPIGTEVLLGDTVYHFTPGRLRRKPVRDWFHDRGYKPRFQGDP